MIFDSDTWASGASDFLSQKFQKPDTHSLTVKAKSSGAGVKSSTSLKGGKITQKVKFNYSVNNINIKKLEFGTKTQSLAVTAEYGSKLHGVDGLTISTGFTHEGNANVGTKAAPKMGQNREFSAEINYSGIKDLGIKASSDVLKMAGGNVNVETVVDYNVGDAKVGCNFVMDGGKMSGALATQYNGGDWKAVLKHKCGNGKFTDFLGMEHSLGFTANLNKNTTLVGLVEKDKITVGGMQNIDGGASLAWKADESNVTLNYKHKLSGSLTLDACTSLPYATSVTGINFGLTYSP